MQPKSIIKQRERTRSHMKGRLSRSIVRFRGRDDAEISCHNGDWIPGEQRRFIGGNGVPKFGLEMKGRGGDRAEGWLESRGVRSRFDCRWVAEGEHCGRSNRFLRATAQNFHWLCNWGHLHAFADSLAAFGKSFLVSYSEMSQIFRKTLHGIDSLNSDVRTSLVKVTLCNYCPSFTLFVFFIYNLDNIFNR